MSRNTPAELKVVIPNTNLDDTTLQAFLDAASLIVDQIEEGCGSDLSQDRLKEVELYLAAHYAASADPSISVKQEKFENASKTYNTASMGQGVLGTPYGNIANVLSNGCLAEIDKPPAFFKAIGTIGEES